MWLVILTLLNANITLPRQNINIGVVHTYVYIFIQYCTLYYIMSNMYFQTLLLICVYFIDGDKYQDQHEATRCYNFTDTVFSKPGTTFLCYLANASQRIVLSVLVLLCHLWSKLNTSTHAKGLLLATVVISVISYRCEFKKEGYSYFVYKFMMCWILLKSSQSRRGKTRQDKTRWHSDKMVSPGFEINCTSRA